MFQTIQVQPGLWFPAAIQTNAATCCISFDSTLYLVYNSGPGPGSAYGGTVWKYHIADGVWTRITPPGAGGGFGVYLLTLLIQKQLLFAQLTGES